MITKKKLGSVNYLQPSTKKILIINVSKVLCCLLAPGAGTTDPGVSVSLWINGITC